MRHTGDLVLVGALAVFGAACAGPAAVPSSLTPAAAHPSRPAPAAPPASPVAATTSPLSPMSPSSAAIRRSLRALTEADYPSTYFDEMADPVVTPDGHGGVFTAVVAVRQETADGHGQIVAFWHDKQFVGWAPGREVASVGVVTPHGPAAFDVSMALYGPGAAMCCPSGGVHVVFAWNGHAFAATKRIPADVDLGSVVVHRH